MYRALLESHLRYSDELWGSLSNTKLDHLQRLQNRARTLIESSRLKDGWTCNWLSVSNLIKFDRATMIYKILNGLCPENLNGKLITRSKTSNYQTRNQQDLDIPRLNGINTIANKIKFQCLHFKKNTEGISPELKSFPKQDTQEDQQSGIS